MKSFLLVLVALTVSGSLLAGDAPFFRGDANDDGIIDSSDIARIGEAAYQGGPPLSCWDAGDVNDDGYVDTADMSYLSSWLNFGGPDPAAPFPFCGVDGTADSLECGLNRCSSAFIRGDLDDDGHVNFNDLSLLNNVLLDPNVQLNCEDAADVDDDGEITQADEDWLSSFLFFGTEPPKQPWPSCDIDVLPDPLDCFLGSCQ